MMYVFDPGDPALPGHFPGRPIVPGVLLLETVIAAARDRWGAALAIVGVERVKFHRALAPGESFRIDFARKSESLADFACVVGEDIIASGRLRAQALP